VDGGRVATIEVMVMTTRLREFVLDPDATDHIVEAIAEGTYYGMQTFDQHLLELYRQGWVTLRDAMNTSSSPHDFRIAVRAAGLQA
jgi:twitching motility protein PilT